MQIDHRRAYNCEIMLSKVKVPLPELMVKATEFVYYLWPYVPLKIWLMCLYTTNLNDFFIRPKKEKSLFYLGRIQVNLDGICTNKFLPDQSLWLRGIGIPTNKQIESWIISNHRYSALRVRRPSVSGNASIIIWTAHLKSVNDELLSIFSYVLAMNLLDKTGIIFHF